MVSILPPGRSKWDAVGQLIGQNLMQTLPRSVEQGYNRGLLQKSLDEIKNISSQPNASPLDITLAAMKAGAGIPGSERYLGQLIPLLSRYAEANASGKVPMGGGAGVPGNELPASRQREPLENVNQMQSLPGFLDQQQENPFFPTNIGPQGGPGNAPQPETQGTKRPLLTPEEKIVKAKELAKLKSEAGIPTTQKEAYDEINEIENDKKTYNAAVDEDLKKRLKSQETYGQRAVQYLKKNIRDNYLTPEIEAIFQKRGEEASRKGESESDINRFLAKEATRFSNTIENVLSNMSAPRAYNAIGRKLGGTYRSFDESAEDLRKHLRPLIDLGLYDTSRRLLSDLGYGPEERDIIINPLSNRAQSVINQVPSIKTTKSAPALLGGYLEGKGPADPEIIKDSLRRIKQFDPNFSLLLARKSFEDKGYDWRDFKNALNDLLEEGFTLEGDQKDQMGRLDTPPLSLLEKMLEGIFIGR